MKYPIARIVNKFFVKRFIKQINGIKNIPNDKNFIIAANHASYLDHLIIACTFIPYLNKMVHFLAKKEHFESFHQKLWHKYFQAIPIDRKNAEEAINTAVRYLKNNKIIVIYPEGTRTLDGKIQRGKTGVARLILLAKVSVMPVGLIGTFDILPKGKYFPRFKKATMNIGELMSFERYYNKKITKKLLRQITNEIMAKIAKLSNQE